ncbi:hypothetical protein L7F22_047764 [Adiantum nelumboides]|nr:hypothetical protein [Adiantum nelumboides]
MGAASMMILALLFAPYVYTFPLCLNGEAPVPLKTSLAFCTSFKQNDSSCCDASTDKQLSSTLQEYNVSNDQCSTYLKQILCAQCDPYAADLFRVQNQQEYTAPVLCNSTLGSNGTSAANGTADAYCKQVWDACRNVPIKNSPFATSLQGSTGPAQSSQNASMLTDLWQTQSDFCAAFGESSEPGQACYSGDLFVPLNSSTPAANLEGICYEKVGDGAYLNLVPHPDGSNRAFLANQAGQIWLATLPLAGSGKNLSVGETPFLDITDRVVNTREYGLLGVALHPNFKENGRFFVSYNCDKSIWPDCGGRCACNADAGCTLLELGPEAGSTPCQISSIIAEYSANTSSSSSPLEALTANPDEVRRIFTMGLPYATHHAGQILFGANDDYLYFMMGDGGSTGDPLNFAQNKMSLLGKILRFDVDTLPSTSEIVSAQLWGNYSIPSDNPFVQDNSSRPEVWAYGLRNPWRCSFDKINPSYLYCADVGQEQFEEVDLITKGGNYGWRTYEGTALYNAPRSPGGNTSANSIQPIFPILEYSHISVNPVQDAASITGGFVSRSAEDACLYGRYVYADLYGGAMWAALETPAGSGNYTTQRVNFTCSSNSTMECKQSEKVPTPNFLYVFSFGEDNANNLYVLSQMGVFKVTDPKSCGFTCNAKLPANAIVPFSPPAIIPSPSPAPTLSIPGPSPSNSSGHATVPIFVVNVVTLVSLFLYLVGF